MAPRETAFHLRISRAAISIEIRVAADQLLLLATAAAVDFNITESAAVPKL